jgi:hypothetical protein
MIEVFTSLQETWGMMPAVVQGVLACGIILLAAMGPSIWESPDKESQ